MGKVKKFVGKVLMIKVLVGNVMGGTQGPRLGFQARAPCQNPGALGIQAGSPGVQGLEFRLQGLESRVQGLKFKVSRFKVSGIGF